jgi:hypothetical protein
MQNQTLQFAATLDQMRHNLSNDPSSAQPKRRSNTSKLLEPILNFPPCKFNCFSARFQKNGNMLSRSSLPNFLLAAPIVAFSLSLKTLKTSNGTPHDRATPYPCMRPRQRNAVYLIDPSSGTAHKQSCLRSAAEYSQEPDPGGNVQC